MCSINEVSEKLSYVLSFSRDRTHHKIKITPVYEELETDTNSHYIEIRLDGEQKIDEELLNFKTEFELLKKSLVSN